MDNVILLTDNIAKLEIKEEKTSLLRPGRGVRNFSIFYAINVILYGYFNNSSCHPHILCSNLSDRDRTYPLLNNEHKLSFTPSYFLHGRHNR